MAAPSGCPFHHGSAGAVHESAAATTDGAVAHDDGAVTGASHHGRGAGKDRVRARPDEDDATHDGAHSGAHEAGHAASSSSSSSSSTSSSSETDPDSETKRRRVIQSRRLDDPLYYGDYLQLGKLLDCQHPKSRETGKEAHDEHLFIVIHQAYELWFKQILHEVDSVRAALMQDSVPERDVGIAVARLQRVTVIQRVLLSQLDILETMSPMGFLEFRDVLFPASGFQSVQFRLLENKLGLSKTRRITYGHRAYCSYLHAADASVVEATETEPSVHDLVEKWLERTPFLELGDFDFWKHYREGVEQMLAEDARSIRSNPRLPEDAKEAQLKELESNREHFDSLFDEGAHRELVRRGDRRISYRAMKAALFIVLHQDEPILQLPARLLSTLVDIDELLTSWRQRHALMVHRMLGVKMGTGGSSGYQYLQAAATRHKVFGDLFNLSTYLVPRVCLPALPPSVSAKLGFVIDGRSEETVGAAAGGGGGK